MQNHNGFRRIICVTILCALLMVSMGRATRVSAVGTTAAIAGTAFILTGAVYLSYIALTQGEMVLPAAEEMHNWLGGIGRKVSQYPSGAAAYQDIYQGLLRDPAANVIDGVWTWTQDRLRSFANDFADTRINENIAGYYEHQDITYIPTNGFNYQNLHVLNETVSGQPFTYYAAQGYTILPMGNIIAVNRSDYQGSTILYPAYTNLQGEWRNLLKTNGKYVIQHYVNGAWVTERPYYALGFTATLPNENSAFYPFPGQLAYYKSFYNSGAAGQVLAEYDWPLLQNRVIHDEDTNVDLPMVIPESDVLHLPSWVDPDNNNRPIIPWVPIPDIPTGIPTPPGYTGPPQWGFPLAELLDLLEELAEGLIKIDAIARLINEFAGQHGDNYYLEYNDGDTNYYNYYQPTVFDNDTEYVTYNIDISEQEDIIPVDLNTIQLYTHNNYLDEVKNAARSFGSAIGEYVAFWHNCDPVVTYTILGSFVLILLGAFIGKWGHS